MLRYTGQWADSDTANLTMAARGVQQEGRLVAKDEYRLGFAFPALTTTIAQVTGLSLTQLQLVVYPLLSASLALLAFVTYREFTGDLTAAALGVLFLFMQPDFLFVILRGSHEKLTWLMQFLAFYLLARSLRAARAQRLGDFGANVGLLYLAVYGLIAGNAFFGSAFILAVGVSLLGGLFILLWARGRSSRVAVTRLIYVAAAAMVIWVLHIFYLYPSAVFFLLNLRNTVERVGAVALGNVPATDPYATIVWGWVSRSAYLALVIPTFTMAGLSFLAWVGRGFGYLRGREYLADELGTFLAWLLYGGFGLQMLVSLVLGRSGGVAVNLQLRYFPVLLMLGVPLVTNGLTQLWRRQFPRRGGRLLAVATALFVLWMSGASLLKATNEPALSNYWMFWTRPEAAYVAWADGHLQYRRIWLGLDGIRLSSQALIAGTGLQSGNVFDVSGVEPDTRDLIVSDVERNLSLRRFQTLPDVRGENRVYDNGPVAHYHMRPRTPYQP
ncbi:MAG TPA: hypothetical protein VMY80_10990 [Anaerolineae bacterium]|nr:hypothetical protein [Anaerolineae bacterium]